MNIIKASIAALHADDTDTDEVDAESLEKFGLTAITLRPYQVVGVNWLLQRYRSGHGALLGDEMGLGKTCQTIAMLVALAGLEGTRGPHLLLCPLSVLDNWKSELRRFAPGLPFVSYVGDKDMRSDLRERLTSGKMASTSVLLTTYEVCLRDIAFLRQHSWHTLVVDEAHRLKNRDSLLHQSLLEFDFKYRVLLTGTPVQNNLRELYTLLCFIAPTLFKFKYCEEFVDTYSKIEEHSAAAGLHMVLRPFLLRRVKAQVVKDLPCCSQVVLFHGLSAIQKDLYKAVLTKDTDAFAHSYNTPKTRLMNILVQLRKCVNHPYLFDGVEPEPFMLGEHLVAASGKLVVLDQLLAYLKPRGHKVLLFSQMTRALDIVQDYLGYRGYSYERLDGSVRGEERYLAIKSFNEQSDTFLFLLSTRAGGVGLNLTSADTVIFLDSDFNPQNDLQAAARAHRIGQTRPVKVVRLVGRSTVEEIVLRRAEAKLRLTEAVIEGDQFSLGADSAKGGDDLIADSALQLKDILKFGVEKLLENDDSTVEAVDFETILGGTVDGAWTDVTDKELLATLSAETMAGEDNEGDDESGDEAQPGTSADIYMYEGKDYSLQPTASDRAAMEALLQAHTADLEEGAGDGCALRRTNAGLLTGVLPEVTRKARKPLSVEEKERRNKKRAETLARKAKQEEEEEARREERRMKRRESLWRSNNYTSCNIQLDEFDDEEDDVSTASADDVTDRSIKYVTGDVTRPDVVGDAIIVHCVDDSGSWGSGGLFSALSRKSALVEEQYELAGEMRDLSLGDVHLIGLDGEPGKRRGNEYVALVVAQTQDRHGTLTGIKLSALSEGLRKLQRAAKEHKASVHLPRLGHSTAGFNWYGTERLLRKHLVSQGVPTYVYYYKRHQQLPKRKGSTSTGNDYSGSESEAEKPRSKKCRHQPPPGVSSARNPVASTSNVGEGLPSFMRGVAVCFIGLSASVRGTLSRYLIAYDGDVHDDIEDCTSHVIVTEPMTSHVKDEVKKITEAYQTVSVAKASWLQSCFVKQRRVALTRHLVDEL